MLLIFGIEEFIHPRSMPVQKIAALHMAPITQNVDFLGNDSSGFE
jgi:hypothetical protein